MGQNLSIATAMMPRITATNAEAPLAAGELVLDQAASITTIYAPFDYIQTKARLVVVGITPGLTQAVNALKAAAAATRKGLDLESALAEAKLTASFSGAAIRNNLIAMLDEIGVASHFGATTTADMFRPGSTAVHFTSALRYPVFVNGKKYNGKPNMLTTPILRSQIDTHLAEEAKALRHAIWLPLGPKAEAAVMHLADRGYLDHKCVLSGMPHPSGENGERVAVFLGRKKPEAASRQTKAAPLLGACARLKIQISSLERSAA